MKNHVLELIILGVILLFILSKYSSFNSVLRAANFRTLNGITGANKGQPDIPHIPSGGGY